MGTQHAKSDDKRLMLKGIQQQQCGLFERNPNMSLQPAEEEIMNDIHIETVISTQNLILEPKPKHSITVADFANIKTEQLAVEDHRNIRYSSELLMVEENQDLQYQNTDEVDSKTSKILLKPALQESEDDVHTVSVPDIGDNFIELNLSGDQCPKYSSLEVKKEILETHGLDNSSKIVNKINTTCQNSTNVTLIVKSTCERADKIQPAVKIETTKDLFINEPINIVHPSTEICNLKTELLECENSGDCEDNIEQFKLVKNPFAFLKKTSFDEQRLTESNNKVN